jgi:hypothetical protein
MRVLTWAGSIAAIAGTALAYRWAEPSREAMMEAHTLGGGTATIRLTDTAFAGYMDGARTWSIHAREVNLLRLPNATLSSIQSASIDDIRNGVLYEPPRSAAPAPGLTATRVMEAGASPVYAGPVAATFHAKHGRYSVGMMEAAPADLEMLYTVQWQFKLDGDVVFRTSRQDELSAPSMTIYTLVDRKSGRPEQRVVCEQGARMVHKGIQVTANSMRFNPKDRTVECLSGVRGSYKGGNVQTERVYWSLSDETLRCPEVATGIVDGMPFEATGLTLDLKHRRHHADRIHLQLNVNALGQYEE